MFTQRKKSYKTFIYTAIILTLCFLIIAIAWPSEPNDKDGFSGGQQVSAEVSAENGGSGEGSIAAENNSEHAGDDSDGSDDFDEDNQNSGAYFNSDDDFDDDGYGDDEDNFPISENSNITGESQSYYLVKRAGDAIKVFFIDRSGNEVELETTDILYDMLGYEDQALFDQGYRVSSQEELAVLLQDFES